MAERKHLIFLASLLFVVLCSLLATTISDLLKTYVILDIPFDMLQFIKSIYNYVEAFAVPLWGFIVDRFPQKRKFIFTLNAAIWIMSGIILYVVPRVTTPLLLGINIAWGIAIGANGPLIASYLGDLFHIEHRGRLFSVFTIALYIIKSSTVAVNGIIGEALSSWVLPLSIFSLLGIVAVGIFWRLAPEPRFGGAEPELAKAKYSYYFRPRELKVILSNKTNQLFILQGFTGMAGVVIVTSYMLYWFTSDTSQAPDGLALSPTLATIILGIGGAIGALVGILLAGYIADWAYKQGKINRVLFLATVCLFLQVVAYAILMVVPTYPSGLNLTITDLPVLYFMYPVFLTFTLGFNITTFLSTPIGTTVGIVRTHVNLPEHRGTAAAIYDFSDFLGAGLGISLANYFFAAMASYRLTVVFGSLFWIISGIIWLIANFKIKKDFANVRQVLQARSRAETVPAMEK